MTTWANFRDDVIRKDLHDENKKLYDDAELLKLVNRALARVTMDINNWTSYEYTGAGQTELAIPDNFVRMGLLMITENGANRVWQAAPLHQVLEPGRASASNTVGQYIVDYPEFGQITLSRSLGAGMTATLQYHKSFDEITADGDEMPFAARPFLVTPLSHLVCYFALMGEATNRARNEQYLSVVDRFPHDNPLWVQADRFMKSYFEYITRYSAT